MVGGAKLFVVLIVLTGDSVFWTLCLFFDHVLALMSCFYIYV